MAKKTPTAPKQKRGNKAPRGQGKGPSRADMVLIRKALRQDWPTSPDEKQLTLDSILAFLKPRTKRGRAAADRTVLMAAQTLAVFCRLTLSQASLDLRDKHSKTSLDLRREKQVGKTSEVSMADLVADAEARAEARRHEREQQ